MTAAYYGRINCVDHLITKGANLHALNDVRRGPAAAWRRGLWGTGSERGEAVRRCLRCPARVVLRWRRCAPPLPRRAAASAAGCRPSAARLACKPAGERAAVAVWGAWGGLGGSHPPQAHATHTHPPATAAHPRACGAAAASRQSKRTALHQAAMAGQTSCVQSLVEAKADVCLKSLVSDDAEIGVGGRGEGCGARVVIKWGGDAYPCPCPCAVMQVPRRLSARAAQPLPSPPGAGASPPPPPPPPSQNGKDAMDWAKPNHMTTIFLVCRKN